MNPSVQTPLPWRQVTILLIVRLADPLSFTILFPFVYFMVKDFHLTSDDAEIGYYVGFIASSFAVAQMLSVIPWGVVSDRVGRRPVILIGILGTGSGLFLFGLSKSLPWAIVTRSICGLLSGNMGVVKTMMAELTDESNRAQGFSLLPMMFGLGSIIGPTIGGFLSNPMDKYPEIIGDGIVGNFLREYPYFLPCGISSFLILLTFVFGFFFLEETLQPPTPILSEVTPLIKPVASSNSIVSFFDEVSSPSWSTILSFAFQSFQGAIQAELFPLWAATPVILGGLGFDTNDIGGVMSFSGFSLLLIQFFIYPLMQNKFGTLCLYQRTYLCFIPIAIIFPFVAFIVSPFWFWTSLLTLTVARTTCNVFIGTSINILLVETCPDKHMLGKINGIAMACSSLVRAFGPTFCGITYSWSLTNDYTSILLSAPFTWLILAVLAFINFNVALRIPNLSSRHQ